MSRRVRGRTRPDFPSYNPTHASRHILDLQKFSWLIFRGCGKGHFDEPKERLLLKSTSFYLYIIEAGQGQAMRLDEDIVVSTTTRGKQC